MKELIQSITWYLKQEYNINVMIDWYFPRKGEPVVFMVYTFSRDGYYCITHLDIMNVYNKQALINHCINQAILEDIAYKLRKSLTKSH